MQFDKPHGLLFLKPAKGEIPMRKEDKNNVRALGYWETGLYWLSEKTGGTGTCFFIASTPLILSDTILLQSYKILFLRHPFLRLVIKNKYSKLYFYESATFKNIPNISINVSSEMKLEKIIEVELKNSVNPKKYLWKMITIKNTNLHKSYFGFLVHHSIIGGVAGLKLLNELITIYEEILNGKKIATISLKLPQCLEKIQKN